MNFNQITLGGRLSRDPQMKYLPSQTAIAEFGIAINRKWKTQSGEDREEVTFIDCTAYGKTAEVINQHLKKGDSIFVVGRVKFDQWEAKDGTGKRSKHSVAVETFQFVGSRQNGQQGGQNDSGQQERRQPDSRPPQRSAPPQNRSQQHSRASQPASAPADPPFGDDQHFEDKDIPFAPNYL